MGVAVSDWKLARAVSLEGQLGVISGTAIAVMLARRLQMGDTAGHMRRALDNFPIPEIATRVRNLYFKPEAKADDVPFKTIPMPSLEPGAAYSELTMVANFVEVFLAKEGHDGVVGINLLEKIQLPTLPSLFGAMLAGVDYVLMGAGIPRSIPGILDELARGEDVTLRIDVAGAEKGEIFENKFSPQHWFEGAVPALKRPFFLGIITSATVAITLARKATGQVDGFVIEGDTAGGHNAPPRGVLQLSESGEPIYGPRDVPELDKIKALGRPFWLAGSFGQRGRLAEAKRLGAVGIQVGTGFAFCNESGIEPKLKQQAIDSARNGDIKVFTDPLASPTGFPFKTVQLEGTQAIKETYLARDRVCDLGFLRHAYRKPNGTVGYRCASEPVDNFVKRGGTVEETVGRKCICNGLLATAGFGQLRRDGRVELPLITAGEDITRITRFLKPGETSYSAADVIEQLLSDEAEG